MTAVQIQEQFADVWALSGDMTSWRRHLHAHPELGFAEHETADFIAARLSDFGLEFSRGWAGTGIVASLEGKNPRGPAIALRADIDALPILEKGTPEHRSTRPGVMHACGHDGHTAMLLGAAKILAARRNFAGRVHFVFQPAEEGGGGAAVMVREGFFDRFPVQAIYGLHNWPGLDVGNFAFRAGPIMACADMLTLTLKGRGGHAAMPHHSHDPIAAAAALVTALHSVVSRNISPLDAAVLSITQIKGGDTHNVIPDEVLLSGTIRSFVPEIREKVIKRMTEICTHLAAAFSCQIEIKIHPGGYPVTVNAKEPTAQALAIAQGLFGAGQTFCDLPPSMGSEDFAFFLEQCPGNYAWLGVGEKWDRLHSPRFDFNDEILPIGACYWVGLTESILAENPRKSR